MTEKFDLIVLGGGSAGLSLSAGAVALGKKVALVEKEKLGGDCLWYGCVPSKTLIHSAKLCHEIRNASSAGLSPMEPDFSFEKVMEHVQEVIQKIQPHDSPDRFRKMGVSVFFGTASFLSSHEIRVGDKTLYGKKIVVATGSHAMVPELPGLEETGYLTNRTIFDLRKRPRSLIVLGGGPIGIELGQAMYRLGVEVTVIQRGPGILKNDDIEGALSLEKILRKEGLEIVTSAAAVLVSKREDEKIVKVKKSDGVEEYGAEEILVAAGRRPNLEGLQLSRASVLHSWRGITVDARMRTNVSHIYACGDVAGGPLFTHTADYQARIVLMNAFLRIPKKFNPSFVPWCTFTDPELAHIGLTEKMAKQKNISYQVYRFPFSEVDRSLTDGNEKGQIKILASPWRGKILGVSILGPSAGELIHEMILAVKHGITMGKIFDTIHIYPTLSGGLNRINGKFYQESRGVQFVKKVLGFFKR